MMHVSADYHRKHGNSTQYGEQAQTWLMFMISDDPGGRAQNERGICKKHDLHNNRYIIIYLYKLRLNTYENIFETHDNP